jgi:hypothetical protein
MNHGQAFINLLAEQIIVSGDGLHNSKRYRRGVQDAIGSNALKGVQSFPPRQVGKHCRPSSRQRFLPVPLHARTLPNWGRRGLV